MQELTAEQMAVLERLHARGFGFVAFPLYERQIGIKKGNCAALLEPVEAPDSIGAGPDVIGASGGMRIVGEAAYMVAGNLSVRVMRGGKGWFVWKMNEVEATAEREEELARFAAELNDVLRARA